MRAIIIDPDQCSVLPIEVEPLAVPETLGAEITATIDFEKRHCLVLNDGDLASGHPARFRFANGPARPFFGPVAILGMQHGNWGPATMGLRDVKARIIWETWDSRRQRYATAVPGSTMPGRRRAGSTLPTRHARKPASAQIEQPASDGNEALHQLAE
jgi:hypothetical protein